jgi:proline iminopeptidase
MREKPTLLLIGADASWYKPALSALADDAQLVYLDARGLGRSERGPSSTWTMDHWADDIAAFCCALDIERPLLLGASIGGRAAMQCAVAHSDLVAKLVLISPLARTDFDLNAETFRRLGGDEAAAAAERRYTIGDDASVADFARLCLPLYNRAPFDAAAMMRLRFDIEVFAGYMPRNGADLTLPPLARVRCPVLLLAGEDDPVTPVQTSAEVAAALPAPLVTFVRLDGCGHGTWIDRPAETLAAIRSFIGA